MKKNVTILGIETSCDETAIAILRSQPEQDCDILVNLLASQIKKHAPYGGVVPEIAARAHGQILPDLIQEGLRQSGLSLAAIDLIAVTAGPGLIGGLIVGLMTAKGLAAGAGIPFYAVNHLEGHVLSPRVFCPKPQFPYLVLLISGGHSELLCAHSCGQYIALGATQDDAAGECFDKAARLLELGYPGGPQIELWAKKGRAGQIILPSPMVGRKGCDFSFSGLKTALARKIAALPAPPTDQLRADFCHGVQQSIRNCLVDRTKNAMLAFQHRYPTMQAADFVVVGGVAANQAVRADLQNLAGQYGFQFQAPPLYLCTDNAVMIAFAALEAFFSGRKPSPMDCSAHARWPVTMIHPLAGWQAGQVSA